MIRFKPLPYLLAGVSLLALPMAQAEELPQAIKAVESRGAEVVGSFDAPGGLKGYAARYNGQGMALYLTPDGEHVLIGSLLDAKGEDLTRAHLEKLVYEPLGKEMWTRMENSTWIADGKADAPRIIYMFSDPNCPYCNMFWKQARPWVESGKVQLRHIMVGMLRADSAGKSAALLSAKDPQAALNEHEAAGKASKLKALEKIPAALEKQLTDNLMLMSELGAQATPAIFYLDDNGRLQQHQGAPQPDALADIMGPR
ncbi:MULTISPECIES: thiol:disulfide interchange protein DsbG [Stutzerimonas stutzeri subgroup]|uniref:Thiol:disulfide interchange protein n=1 Tax=Stutzerimonas stutzeri TaxID=316 RepID=A0A2N8RJE5_STUST|nr:thiol:disulfide interchange protein DsbG [Stutzerimonas stutzeri]MBA1239245.1 thiol:disulfide interchange protein DsbG [Stutzerimonas kunmingensis]MDH2240949.1 thiol:disulfide interchange protein DsbG [Pseudomonas sp. GD03909]MDH2244946.1 thiol:disulfide interchange protein DsbG [Pseudomonas sp. GD03856]MDH2263825.1 thiol:disulfide interchange protein DsbG [Pseudomonas sp. GD03855]MCQ4252541.1 thiol:disulfide interchange protein DsbG [Stutzerimonas stutzeri]